MDTSRHFVQKISLPQVEHCSCTSEQYQKKANSQKVGAADYGRAIVLQLAEDFKSMLQIILLNFGTSSLTFFDI